VKYLLAQILLHLFASGQIAKRQDFDNFLISLSFIETSLTYVISTRTRIVLGGEK
jgi:hypothetical protein